MRRSAIALVGPWYRVARALHLPTRAARQAERQGRVPMPDTPTSTVAPAGRSHRPLRVLLLGNGPVEGPGLLTGEPGFADRIAEGLSARTGAPVQVRTVVGGAWDVDELPARLAAEQLTRQDVLVVSAAYRPQLAEIGMAAWRSYTAALAKTLVASAGTGTLIRVLALPWDAAVRDAPEHWGGAFGGRVLALADTAESALDDHPRAVLLRLAAPLEADEWHGPAFSPDTYGRWATQVVDDLAPLLVPSVR